MGGRYFAFRAFIVTLKIIAALTLIFGIGELVLSTALALLAPTVVESNPTINDLSLNSFDLAFSLMPNAPTGFAELDESMAALRNFGRAEIPVREVSTVFGLWFWIWSVFRIVVSALFAFLLWALAEYLGRKVRQWEYEEDVRQSAYFMQQYPPARLPGPYYPEPPRTYNRAQNGVWAEPTPPSRTWSPPRGVPPPPPPSPTALDSYLKRHKKRPAPYAENRPTPSKGLLPFEQTPLGQYTARQRQQKDDRRSQR